MSRKEFDCNKCGAKLYWSPDYKKGDRPMEVFSDEPHSCPAYNQQESVKEEISSRCKWEKKCPFYLKE